MTTEPQPTALPASSKALNWSRLLRRFGTLLGLLLIVAFFSWQRADTFMTVPNWINITRQVSTLGVVAFTMTIVMVVGEFDLSVGAMASLAAIVAGTQLQLEHSLLAAFLAALGVGILGGLLNGILVAHVGISAFVATLGTLTIFRGLALYTSGGATIFGQVIPPEVGEFGNGGLVLSESLEIPNLVLIALLVLIIVWVLLEQTVFGRRLYAIGGNAEAARLGGVRVNWLRMSTFVLTGLGAAIAGLMQFSRLSRAHPTQGEGLMLQAIAAVFLGMTMSEEGEPHVLGTLVGVLILGVLANGLTQLQIDSYIQQILTGVIIILAVAISSLSRGRSALLVRLQSLFNRQRLAGERKDEAR